MKLKKGTLLFLLLTCLAYTTLAQTNYELQGSDVTIDGNGIITACGCTFDNKRIIIPEKIGDITITGIGDNAFKEENLVAVVFAAGSKVTAIGASAFQQNQITELTLPTTLKTIGRRAFLRNVSDTGSNKITELTLPVSLTTIGSEGFFNNDITELTIPEGSQLETIGDETFRFNKITKLTILNNSQLTTIGDYAFYSNQITGLSLPPTLTTIGANAFEDNSLTSVAFKVDLNKSQIKSIGSYAFNNNTELTGITLPEHAEGDGITYKDSKNQEYSPGESFTDFTRSLVAVFPAHTLTADDVKVENEIITKCTCNFFSNSIIIPEKIGTQTIKEIGTEVFQEKNLVTVAFAAESKITSIGNYAFAKNQIATLTLPTTLTTIGNYAFQNNQIATLTLPTTLTTIENYAFENNNIKELSLPTTLTTIGRNAFSFQNNQLIIKLTKVTFEGNENDKSMIRSIGTDAFSSNTGLMSITLPYNGNNNFRGYRDSNGGEYGEGATITDFTLGYNAFIPYELTVPKDIDVNSDGIITICNCNNFTSRDISIPASITKDGNAVNIVGIGALVFNNKQLTSVVLPEGLISIGIGAFEINSLVTLIIPSSVKYIDSKAFRNSNLTDVTFARDDNNKANIISIGHEAFARNAVTSINLPNHVQGNAGFKYKDSDGNEYAEGAEFIDFDHSLYADIPYTLTADDIEVDAANGVITKCNCDNFDSRTITIPTTITKLGSDVTITITGIGNNVFGNKTFATVSFEAGSQITAIGSFAFNNNRIATLTLPTTLTTIGREAFSGNPLESFTLPLATKEGFRTYWQDGNSRDLGTNLTINQADGDFAKSFELVSIEQFTLTVEVNNEAGGSIEPSDDHFVVDKTATPSTQVLTAKPADGWRFDKWVISDEQDKTDNPTTITLDKNKTATAYFVEIVTLTLTIQGVGQVQGLEVGENPIDKGQEFTITATPNEGHEFEKWVFEGSNISTSTYTIPADKTQDKLSIEVHFEKKPFNDPVELTISTDGQGTVTPNTGINTYERGSGVDLTATPQDGWKFDKWVITSGEDGNGNPITETVDDVDHVVTVDADKTATAHFVEAVILTLTIKETEDSGEVSGLNAGENKIDKGADFELKATPASGQRFVSWTIGVETIVTEEYTLPATDTEADISITVTFEAIPQQVTLTLAIEGEGSINPSVEPNSVDPDNEMKGMYDIDTEVTLEATPNDGWRFDKWVIGTDESTDNPTDGISMDTDKTATAHFVKEEEEEAITSILTEVVSANPYPNPVTSQITLKAKDGDLIQLFSQKGGQQYSAQHTGNEAHTIDVSTLPVGVYLVRITDAEGNTTTKRILKK